MPALYIHVPFCPSKCHYCDFYSRPPRNGEEVEAYLAALEKEATIRSSTLNEAMEFGSLFLGGGTPSLLTPNQLQGMLHTVARYFPLLPEAEVTMEANPGTIDEESLRGYRELGINRLSLGIQTLQAEELTALGRAHSLAQAEEAVAGARRAGFTNLNLDLIYGLPGQTLSSWEDTLEQALAWRPEHLALYGLKVEEGTVFHRRQEAGTLLLPEEDETVAMYRLAQRRLAQASFAQYEISNWALPGYQCRNNRVYWENGPYIGLGPAAASHWGGRRWTNHRDLERYQGALAQGRLPVEEEETLDWKDQLAETLFLGLRLMEGVDLGEVSRRFGREVTSLYRGPLEKLQTLGLVVLDGERMALTPKALPIANEVFQEFLL